MRIRASRFLSAPEWVASLPAGKSWDAASRKSAYLVDGGSHILDDVYDAETARTSFSACIMAYFNYLKNLWDKKELAANYAFTFLNHIDAKRESAV